MSLVSIFDIFFVTVIVMFVVGTVAIALHARRQWRAGVRRGSPAYDGGLSDSSSSFGGLSGSDCGWSDSGGGGDCGGGGGGD
jgi:uncharacterized membrane protein YgcG